MSDSTAFVITIFIFFGWIPILSICKGIAWIVEAAHSGSNEKGEEYEDEN